MKIYYRTTILNEYDTFKELDNHVEIYVKAGYSNIYTPLSIHQIAEYLSCPLKDLQFVVLNGTRKILYKYPLQSNKKNHFHIIRTLFKDRNNPEKQIEYFHDSKRFNFLLC